MNIYGYARVSTCRQDLDRQLDIIKKYNCLEILTEKVSGVKSDRPELNRLKDKVRNGDTLIIESFSRLGRSTKDLIELVEWFENNGVKLVSIKENFDTNTPQGKLMLTVFQAFSQFERDLIAQRTKEGLQSARARGRNGGRPKVKDKKVEKALKLYNSNEYSISEIVEMSGISRATLYRYIRSTKNQLSEENSNKEKIAEVEIWLRVENNNKYVRGKGKVKEKIERYLRSDFNMHLPNLPGQNCDYIIHVPYLSLEGLEKTIYDIFNEMESEANYRNCFIEVDAQCVELGLSW